VFLSGKALDDSLQLETIVTAAEYGNPLPLEEVGVLRLDKSNYPANSVRFNSNLEPLFRDSMFEDRSSNCDFDSTNRRTDLHLDLELG